MAKIKFNQQHSGYSRSKINSFGLKKLLMLFITTLAVNSAFAQINFSRYSIGGGVGVTQSFSDLQKIGMAQSFLFNTDYYFTPYITAGIEGQFGTIKGGDKLTDAHLRQFQNGYMSVLLNGKVQFGEFINYENSSFLYHIKGVYLGTGVGFIKNKMTKIERVKQDGSNYIFPGADQSNNLQVPLNFGINFTFNDSWGQTRYIVNAGVQMNLTIGEGLDGYNDPSSIFKNNSPDMYSFTSVGVKYCFGPEGISYRRR